MNHGDSLSGVSSTVRTHDLLLLTHEAQARSVEGQRLKCSPKTYSWTYSISIDSTPYSYPGGARGSGTALPTSAENGDMSSQYRHVVSTCGFFANTERLSKVFWAPGQPSP
jgi:hypothetical protein